MQAAIEEFRQHGFNGTSMDRVAAAAEVSKRTVYNHFPSKEDLFEAILMLMWERSRSPEELVYNPTNRCGASCWSCWATRCACWTTPASLI